VVVLCVGFPCMLASMLGLTDGCGMLRSVVTPQDTPEGRLLPPTHDHHYNAWMPRDARYQPMDCVGDETLASFCEAWRTPLKTPQEFMVRDRQLMATEHDAGHHVTSDTSWGLKGMRTADSNKTLAHLLLREMVDDDMPVSATGAILYVREGVGTDDASDLTKSVFDWMTNVHLRTPSGSRSIAKQKTFATDTEAQRQWLDESCTRWRTVDMAQVKDGTVKRSPPRQARLDELEEIMEKFEASKPALRAWMNADYPELTKEWADANGAAWMAEPHTHTLLAGVSSPGAWESMPCTWAQMADFDWGPGGATVKQQVAEMYDDLGCVLESDETAGNALQQNRHRENWGMSLPCTHDTCDLQEIDCDQRLEPHLAAPRHCLWLARAGHSTCSRRGLFADADIPRNTWIATFGPLLWIDLDRATALNGYSMQMTRETSCGSVTAWATPKPDWEQHQCTAEFINHTCCIFHTNALFCPDGETYNVLLVKAIVSGQEILANYVQGSRKPYAADIQRVFNWTCSCCACCHRSPQCSH
jgi:hypothetical protein